MRAIACLVLTACAAQTGTATQPVTNGSDDTGDPAVVALVDDLGNVGCTASVIEAHTAVTAAHCIESFDPRKLRVWSGGGIYSAISGGRIDPMYDGATFANDVAMLTFRDAAQVAPLVLETAMPVVGDVVRVVGYGTTGAMASDNTMKRAGSAMISDVQAAEYTVMPAPSQPCHGDSGGPAITAAGTIGGVVSHGDNMCSDHAVYARVDAARAFIDQYLAATAPGTASVGQACLYDGQCDGGRRARSDGRTRRTGLPSRVHRMHRRREGPRRAVRVGDLDREVVRLPAEQQLSARITELQPSRPARHDP